MKEISQRLSVTLSELASEIDANRQQAICRLRSACSCSTTSRASPRARPASPRRALVTLKVWQSRLLRQVAEGAAIALPPRARKAALNRVLIIANPQLRAERQADTETLLPEPGAAELRIRSIEASLATLQKTIAGRARRTAAPSIVR